MKRRRGRERPPRVRWPPGRKAGRARAGASRAGGAARTGGWAPDSQAGQGRAVASAPREPRAVVESCEVVRVNRRRRCGSGTRRGRALVQTPAPRAPPAPPPASCSPPDRCPREPAGPALAPGVEGVTGPQAQPAQPRHAGNGAPRPGFCGMGGAAAPFPRAPVAFPELVNLKPSAQCPPPRRLAVLLALQTGPAYSGGRSLSVYCISERMADGWSMNKVFTHGGERVVGRGRRWAWSRKRTTLLGPP